MGKEVSETEMNGARVMMTRALYFWTLGAAPVLEGARLDSADPRRALRAPGGSTPRRCEPACRPSLQMGLDLKPELISDGNPTLTAHLGTPMAQVQLALRISRELRDQIDVLTEQLEEIPRYAPSGKMNRSACMRILLVKGLEVIRKEEGLEEEE